MQRILSFDMNPPLALPLRFFLTVPLFAALAAALLLWQGEAALATRWSSVTLALTHLLTLGCLTMAMIGALLQILPVMAGIAVPGSVRTGRVTHALLCAGTLLLAGAFLLQWPWLFAPAMLALGACFLVLLGACTVGLWQQYPGGADASLTAIRLALAALAVTVTMGLLLAAAYAFPSFLTLPLLTLTDLHATWGLLGWVGLLVIGVAFQVVPMFQVTEPYPRWLTGGYCTALFLLLVAASLSTGVAEPFRLASLGLLGLGFGAFALATLWLLAHRKRPAADATTLFWRCALASLLAAMLTGLLPANGATDLARGVLLVVGFALSTINGMLYKIVPFLTWYHLQHGSDGRKSGVPGIQKIIPAAHAQGQFGAHCAALLLLVAACFAPAALARPAAAVLCLSCAALWLNLWRATRLYARLSRPAAADVTGADAPGVATPGVATPAH